MALTYTSSTDALRLFLTISYVYAESIDPPSYNYPDGSETKDFFSSSLNMFLYCANVKNPMIITFEMFLRQLKITRRFLYTRLFSTATQMLCCRFAAGCSFGEDDTYNIYIWSM
jgi:hypothetical protein